MSDPDKLIRDTERDIDRLEKKERSPAHFVLGVMLYGGTLGLLFVVPLIAGAYLGRWLDTLSRGYSVRWTISLIMLGLALGFYNVLRFLKGKI
ncbi:MAG TPA: F0F1 ATP synthase subunit [Rhizobium sp.]|nr:F0F1 ATP synthase subunit [Rhizobium sp.]